VRGPARDAPRWRHVGVGPKWIVRRSRVQDAAERVARGERIDWAATAQELGYHDQAHLIRDFRAQVGFTPAAYARRCAASTQLEPVDRQASDMLKAGLRL
jgi:AraC-like DNA-binding protein